MVTGTVNPSVLDSALGDLVLRIQGSNHNGQVLRLKSAKCTIGSGPNCTLRLRSRDVDPLHCLILRGPNGAVIRRWSPDTRLNGRTFTDAPLCAGDRLSIGSLEFEIVETDETSALSPAATAFYTDQYQQYPAQMESRKDAEAESQQLDARESQLRREEESLDLRTKQLEKAATALQAEQARFEDEFRQWEEYRNASLLAESQQRAIEEEEQSSRLRAQWAELESERNILTLQQQQWQSEQEAAQQQLPDRERQFNERTEELNALAAELDTRKTQLDAQTADLELHNKELADRAAELAAQIAKNNALAKELDTRSAQIDTRELQLEAQTADLELHNKELADQAAELATQIAKNNAFAGELDARSAQLEAHSGELQTQAAELTERCVQLDAQAAEIEKKAAELENRSPELNTQSADLQAISAEIDAKQLELATERNQWEETCRAREKTLTLWEEEIIKKAAQLETLQAQFHTEKQNWENQLAQHERDREQWEAERTERKLPVEVSSTGEMPAVEADVSPQSEKALPEVDDIIRHPGRDIETPEEGDDFADEESPSAPSSAEHDEDNETTAGLSAHQSPAHEKEESIDDYMLRLMQRIRSTQGELSNNADKPNLPAASRSDSAPLPFETMLPMPETPIYTPAQRRESGDLSPRSPAPEKGIDITALRDLAIYSAQNALDTHSRQQMMFSMYSKLAVALVGGFTGMGLLWVWQIWFTNSLTFYSAMLSFAVTLIWGAQYVVLTIRLLTNGSGTFDAVQKSHAKDKWLKMPDEQHALSTIAGDEAVKKDEE